MKRRRFVFQNNISSYHEYLSSFTFYREPRSYTLDTSIKITPKCPAAYADDRPIIMGILFVIHKFKFYFIYIGYIYSITKLSKNFYELLYQNYKNIT